MGVQSTASDPPPRSSMTGVLVVLYLGLLVCLVGTVLAAAVLRNSPALTNALVSLAVAVSPTIVPVILGDASLPVLDVAPLLSVWLAVAGLAHTIGMFGPYDTVWWWDHVTHTLSAALLAALIYATLLAAHHHVEGIALGPPARIGGTLLCTLAFGVVWEFFELLARELGRIRGVDPVLEYYGLRDTVLDLAFNAFGAGIVVAVDLRIMVPIVEADPELASRALGAAVALGFVAIVVITVWLEWRP